MLSERVVASLPRLSVQVFLLVVTLVSVCQGHSWIACTDYLEKNGADWDQTLCRAFPRHGHQYTPRTGQFGLDTGYNYNGVSENSPCRTERDDQEAYNSEHPMAVYYAGQEVILTHPTKNHVADVRCTNKYIPDNGNKIYRSTKNIQSDPTLSDFEENLVADLGTSPSGYQVPDEVTTQYPKRGYQNAPKFCDNMDKALATFNFTVPADLTKGRYTFMWLWQFNSGEYYSSCWEADVVTSISSRNRRLRNRGLDTSEPTDVAIAGTPSPSNPPPTTPTVTHSSTTTTTTGTTPTYTTTKSTTTQQGGSTITGTGTSSGGHATCSCTCSMPAFDVDVNVGP